MPDFIRETMLGAVAGCVEVSCMQPTIAIKNAVQEGRAVSFTPTALYRGYFVNLATVAPMTAVQFGATGGYTQAFAALTERLPRGEERVACAAMGGATAALVGAPAELIVIQQQRAGVIPTPPAPTGYRHISSQSRIFIV
jgi:hypothetical protein